MTYSEAVKILAEAGVDDPEFSAGEIFSELGGISRVDITLGRGESNSPQVISAIKRRAEREPLQYIIGCTYFFREKYTVNESCLIPRSDTELLVEVALKNIPAGEIFADICAGSGCVGISTLKNSSDTRCIFIDISKGALEIAEKNAFDNGVRERAEFLKMDVMRELPEKKLFAVLSNPPYVSKEAYKTLPPELMREPKIAFLGGDDGADFYRSLTPRILPHLKDGGFIAYEIGFDQGEIISEIAKSLSLDCKIFKDLSGNDRVALLRRRATI